MMDNIVYISKATGDGTMQTPEMALNDALEDIRSGSGAFKNGKKLLILCVDDTEENYNLNWIQAGMTMSECLALCDVAKTRFLYQMGYSLGEGDI